MWYVVGFIVGLIILSSFSVKTEQKVETQKAESVETVVPIVNVEKIENNYYGYTLGEDRFVGQANSLDNLALELNSRGMKNVVMSFNNQDWHAKEGKIVDIVTNYEDNINKP